MTTVPPQEGPQLSASGVRVERDVPCRLRDGTVLRSDVFRPPHPGRYPVLLMRVPYNKAIGQSFVYQHPVWYARHGYVVVVQDCRGRYASDGEFSPLRTEAEDGYDAIEWAAQIAESNGRVGTYGFSYAGATQLLAAAEQPPSLRCCVPAFTASDYYDGWMYDRGVLNLSFVLSWTVLMLAGADAVRSGNAEAVRNIRNAGLDLQAVYADRPLDQVAFLRDSGIAPYFFDWLEHDTRDDYWSVLGLDQRYDRITVPCLHVGGWFDVFATGTVTNYEELARRAAGDPSREQRLLMGPWIHMPWSAPATGNALGPAQLSPVDDAQLRWFDRWLKDAPPAQATSPIDSPVAYFLMGANEWVSTSSWPTPGARDVSYYLSSDGRANSRGGTGVLSTRPADLDCPPDVYVYDPNNPVPSAGGNSCCNSSAAPMGQRCQACVEVRNDVLVYTSEPLEEAIETTGTARVTLYAATSADDTDWVARLVDVAPDGTALNVAQGIVRARFHADLAHPRLIAPETVTEYTIALNPTSWLFRRDHRVRLQITSSDFPAKEPNLNNGHPQGSTSLADAVVATQTVLHDGRHPSRLTLPTTSH